MFLGPAAAPRRRLRAAVRRRLQPRHPHRRAAHVGAAAVRPRGQGDRRAATTPASTGRSSRGRPIVLTERGDTVTENALMAAALHPGTTVIRNASSNYMVQDLCFYLQQLGVDVEGIGTTTLTVTGRAEIDVDVDYAPSEDPIEAMSLLAAAIVTESDDHHPAGADRVPRDRAGAAGGDGLPVRPLRGVRRPQRPHPAGRPHHPPERAARAARQDPPDAVPRPQHRQPAVLRGDRGGRRRPDAAARLGLREPRDLPHRAQQARRRRSSCSTRTG